jgi:hypothetical protein
MTTPVDVCKRFTPSTEPTLSVRDIEDMMRWARPAVLRLRMDQEMLPLCVLLAAIHGYEVSPDVTLEPGMTTVDLIRMQEAHELEPGHKQLRSKR